MQVRLLDHVHNDSFPVKELPHPRRIKITRSARIRITCARLMHNQHTLRCMTGGQWPAASRSSQHYYCNYLAAKRQPERCDRLLAICFPMPTGRTLRQPALKAQGTSIATPPQAPLPPSLPNLDSARNNPPDHPSEMCCFAAGFRGCEPASSSAWSFALPCLPIRSVCLHALVHFSSSKEDPRATPILPLFSARA